MSKFLNSVFIGMLFTCLFLCQIAFATHDKPVTVTAGNLENLGGGVYNVNLHFKIQPDWHVYAHDETENGLPLKIGLKSLNAHVSKVSWPPSKEEYVESEDIKIRTKFYENEILVPVTFRSYSGNEVIFKIELGACNKICIAQTEEFSVKLEKKCILCDLVFYGLLALLGGFILNLMPCVFPVISLKVFSFAASGAGKTKDSAIYTVLGIIFSYIVLAVITVILKNLGEAIGWGLHFQSAYFVVFLAFIMVLFAYNLNGDFEILINTSAFKFVDSFGNNAKSFFVGATATLLATPCTAPFLSTAVAFAVTKDAIVIFYIYFMLGLGMSLPFIVIAIYPSAGKFLPKAGDWMLKLKKIFAVLFLLTAFWLIYILYFQISLSGLISFVLMLILLKFTLSFKCLYERILRLILLLLISLFFIYGVIWYFEKQKSEYEHVYSEGWLQYSDKFLEESIQKGDLILVDVTAEWCVTCKLNKLTTLGNEEVLSFLRENNVVLLRADVTNSNEVAKSLMKHHDRYGIPLNVIYSERYKGGYLLPHILSPSLIYEAIKENKRTK